MYYLIKVFDKNKNIIIESNKVYECDLHKFLEFTKFSKNEFTIELKNISEDQEKNNNDLKTQTEVIHYEMNNGDITNNKNDEEYISDSLFEGMFIEKYGKGYTLRCSIEHPDYGTKYYHNAWWFPTLNAWFFKQENLDYYLDEGAELLEK